MTPDQFWGLSLRELWLERQAFRERTEDEYDRDAILAWQIMRVKVTSENQKQLVDVKTLLRKRRTTPQQDLEAQVHQLSARLGIPLQKEVKP